MSRNSTPSAVRLPAKVQDALDAALAYAADTIPRPAPQPNPHLPDPDYPPQLRKWCEVRGVPNVTEFLRGWGDTLVRLADEVESLGDPRGHWFDAEPVPFEVTFLLRQHNLAGYLAQVADGLLHRAFRVAMSRRTFARVRAGETVPLPELAQASKAKDEWKENHAQLRD